MVKSWEDQDVLAIINAVKQSPFIWDYKNPQYKNKLKRGQFWDSLTLNLNKERPPNVAFTSLDLSKKWNNLKTYFNIEHQKLIRAKKSGASAEDVEDIDSNWKYKKSLEFLAPTTEPTPTINNFNKKNLAEIFSEDSNIEYLLEIDDSDEAYEAEATVDSINNNTTQSNSNISSSFTQNSYNTPHCSRKKRKNNNSNSELEQVCSASTKLAESLVNDKLNPNPIASFSNFVFTEINGLNTELQLEAKSKITAILFDLQSKQLNYYF